MRKKRLFAFLVFLLGINLVAVNLLYSKTTPPSEPEENDFYKKLDLFTSVLAIVQKSYVEPVDSQDLIYGSLKGMLGSLDPHSQFMDPDMYKEMKVETEGEFGGLGIEITIKDKWLTVVTPMPETPAFEVGMMPGDRIIKIDGESTEDITLFEAVKKLRGKPGSTVDLMIMRKGKGEFIEFTVERAIIHLESIKDVKMVDPGIGYVRITQFQEHTSDDLVNSLNELKKEGMGALVLDLRNNPGGLLSEAIDVSEVFIGEKLIVSQRGRLPEQNAEYQGQGGSSYLELPLVVLINGGSASGSEIVAGAVQDYGRGIILGSKSFGKGSVQSVLPMKDGSALRLTTAKYFTPKDRSVHGVGIEPDIVVELTDEEEINLIKKRRKEKLRKLEESQEEKEDEEVKVDEKEEKKDKEEDELAKVEDIQLQRAVDLLKGLNILINKPIASPWLLTPIQAKADNGKTPEDEPSLKN